MDEATDVLKGVLVVLHLLGMAGVVGGWLANVRTPKIAPVMLHGALTSLVTGLLLVGAAYGTGDGDDVDNTKITFKLAIALAVLALIWINRRREAVPGASLALIGGLAVANVFIAVLWA